VTARAGDCDPRFITIRRGGTLTDTDHRLLALWAAAYAIKAVRAAAPSGEAESADGRKCRWQRGQLPEVIRELVLDDQRLRNEICWSVFDA
jgi:hypothetical protein